MTQDTVQAHTLRIAAPFRIHVHDVRKLRQVCLARRKGSNCGFGARVANLTEITLRVLLLSDLVVAGFTLLVPRPHGIHPFLSSRRIVLTAVALRTTQLKVRDMELMHHGGERRCIGALRW
jgi:hypothetical protein